MGLTLWNLAIKLRVIAVLSLPKMPKTYFLIKTLVNFTEKNLKRLDLKLWKRDNSIETP
jgi:hypothetical protein